MLVYHTWILWEWRIFDQFLKAELEIDGNSLELSLQLSCFIAPFGQWEQNTEMPRYAAAGTSAVSCTDRRRLSLHNKSRGQFPDLHVVWSAAVNTFGIYKFGAKDPFLSRGVQFFLLRHLRATLQGPLHCLLKEGISWRSSEKFTVEKRTQQQTTLSKLSKLSNNQSQKVKLWNFTANGKPNYGIHSAKCCSRA